MKNLCFTNVQKRLRYLSCCVSCFSVMYLKYPWMELSLSLSNNFCHSIINCAPTELWRCVVWGFHHNPHKHLYLKVAIFATTFDIMQAADKKIFFIYVWSYQVAKLESQLSGSRYLRAFIKLFLLVMHYTDVIWASWRLKSPAPLFFYSLFILATKETAKLRFIGPLCGERLVGSPHKSSAMWASCPCPGIILCMRPANERLRYIVTHSLVGWAHT